MEDLGPCPSVLIITVWSWNLTSAKSKRPLLQGQDWCQMRKMKGSAGSDWGSFPSGLNFLCVIFSHIWCLNGNNPWGIRNLRNTACEEGPSFLPCSQHVHFLPTSSAPERKVYSPWMFMQIMHTIMQIQANSYSYCASVCCKPYWERPLTVPLLGHLSPFYIRGTHTPIGLVQVCSTAWIPTSYTFFRQGRKDLQTRIF